MWLKPFVNKEQKRGPRSRMACTNLSKSNGFTHSRSDTSTKSQRLCTKTEQEINASQLNLISGSEKPTLQSVREIHLNDVPQGNCV